MTIAPGTTAFYDQWAATGEEAARSAMSRRFEAAFAPGARVLMAVPEMQPGLLADGHDRDGRQFTNHDPERVQRLLAGHGFALRLRDELVTPSTDTRWFVLLFER